LSNVVIELVTNTHTAGQGSKVICFFVFKEFKKMVELTALSSRKGEAIATF